MAPDAIQTQSAAPEFEPGAKFGDYTVEALLFRTHFGAAYRAARPGTPSPGPACLTIVSTELSGSRERVVAFFREARALESAGRHPTLLPMVDYGEEAGRLFWACELPQGRSLAEILQASGVPLTSDCVTLLRELARSLAHLHASGRRHGAIDPDHILFDSSGNIRLLTGGGTVVFPSPGHPSAPATAPSSIWYTAPECASLTRAPDATADIYSMACCIVHALTGKPPFDAAATADLVQLHATAPRPDVSRSRPDLPPGLAQLLNHMMRADPAHRIATAAEVLAQMPNAAPVPLPPALTTTPALVPIPMPSGDEAAESLRRETYEKPRISIFRPGDGDDAAPLHRLIFYGGTVLALLTAVLIGWVAVDYPGLRARPRSTATEPVFTPKPAARPETTALPDARDGSRVFLDSSQKERVIAAFETRRRAAVTADSKLLVAWRGMPPGGEWRGTNDDASEVDAYGAARSLWVPAGALVPTQLAPLIRDPRQRYTLAVSFKAARLVIILSDVSKPGELRVLHADRHGRIAEGAEAIASQPLLAGAVQEVVFDITPLIRRELSEGLGGGCLIQYVGTGIARIARARDGLGGTDELQLACEFELPLNLAIGDPHQPTTPR
jgi:serine/threonine-protein kinase